MTATTVMFGLAFPGVTTHAASTALTNPCVYVRICGAILSGAEIARAAVNPAATAKEYGTTDTRR
jgi:hypothetical protein